MSIENSIYDPQLEDQTIETISKWDELDINTDLLRGIYAYGFENPSPIQRKGIKPLVDGRDVIGQAQSGTGKTATFCIGALSHVDISQNTNQILIMSPTHELSRQTSKVITSRCCLAQSYFIATLRPASSLSRNFWVVIQD